LFTFRVRFGKTASVFSIARRTGASVTGFYLDIAEESLSAGRFRRRNVTRENGVVENDAETYATQHAKRGKAAAAENA
jgi:hypothetical protein